jgi:hypothetical protein
VRVPPRCISIEVRRFRSDLGLGCPYGVWCDAVGDFTDDAYELLPVIGGGVVVARGAPMDGAGNGAEALLVHLLQ